MLEKLNLYNLLMNRQYERTCVMLEPKCESMRVYKVNSYDNKMHDVVAEIKQRMIVDYVSVLYHNGYIIFGYNVVDQSRIKSFNYYIDGFENTILELMEKHEVFTSYIV